MSLFEGKAPPNVTTTATTAATAPQYLTDYLTKLAQAGQGQLGVSGADLVAAPSALQQQAYSMAPGVATAYQPAMTSALQAGQAGAAPVSQADISAFYNPYEQDVVNRMAEQSTQNVQRQMLPQLRAAFGGTGAFGSQRYAGAIGQALGDVQANLLGEQAKYRAAGYQSALDAALRQRGLQTQAAQALGGIGASTETAATGGLKALSDIGAQQQALEQAKIEAPTVRAQNIAQIMRGYTYPTTVQETRVGPAQIYQPSPLSQIAGLGSLLGAAFNTPQGFGNRLVGGISSLFGQGAAPTGYGTTGTNPIYGGVDTAGTFDELMQQGSYDDSGNPTGSFGI